jgi:hypothetical protein
MTLLAENVIDEAVLEAFLTALQASTDGALSNADIRIGHDWEVLAEDLGTTPIVAIDIEGLDPEEDVTPGHGKASWYRGTLSFLVRVSKSSGGAREARRLRSAVIKELWPRNAGSTRLHSALRAANIVTLKAGSTGAITPSQPLEGTATGYVEFMGPV